MPEFGGLLWGVIATALIFDFVNGWNDSANAIATVVGTRVLSPLRAVMLSATLNMAGALMGQEVAKTVAGKLVDPELISQTVLIAAMGGAIIWAAAMTLLGMPISASHSLVGGLVGAAVAKAGVHVVQAQGIVTILAAMLFSPVLGFAIAYLLFMLIARVFHNSPPGPTGRMFGLLQLVSVSGMALTHGMNDAQKIMGIITLGLVLGGYQDHFRVPLWAMIACGAAISLGTAMGGWKVIRTLGHKLSRLKPVDGFAAETAATSILFGVAWIGVPGSTTHTITGAILGVGATKGLGGVRWGLGGKIVLAWVFTLPSTIAMSGLLYWILWAGCGLDHEPPAPWKLEFAASEGQVRLEWPEIRQADGYDIYRYDRISAQEEAQHLAAQGDNKKYVFELRDPETRVLVGKRCAGHSFTDQTVKPGGRYVYRMRAVNDGGPSRWSDEHAVDVPPQPQRPRKEPVDDP